MIDETEKWISGTPFAKFVKPTRGGELYLKKPYPHVTIISPLNPKIESWFVCQTVERDAQHEAALVAVHPVGRVVLARAKMPYSPLCRCSR